MSRNGSGTYSLPAGNPVVTNTTISSTWANSTLADIANALTGSVASDGQTTMSGNLQMGNNLITGLADGTNPTDAATVGQLSGMIHQTVQATFNTQSTTTSVSFVNTSVTATITPTNTASKILVMVSSSAHVYNYGNEQNIDIYNGTSEVAGSYRINKVFLPIENIGQENWNPVAIMAIDNPATTSPVTYTVRQRCTNGTLDYVGFGSNDTGSSCIILVEIL